LDDKALTLKGVGIVKTKRSSSELSSIGRNTFYINISYNMIMKFNQILISNSNLVYLYLGNRKEF